MSEIVLLGTGNLATHLFEAFSNHTNYKIIQVYGRTQESAGYFKDKVSITSDFRDLRAADIYLTAVSDHAIQEVIQRIPAQKGLVAHTSGSTPLLSLAQRNGVFYPVQTFTKNTTVCFSGIPVCVEADSESDTQLLEDMAKSISNHVYRLNSEQRKALHLAAVFSCNFTNHLYRIAEDICNKHLIDFKILQPLIIETAQKLTVSSAKENQTGPAIRKDQNTIKRQLDQLQATSLKELYTLFTQLIQQENEGKL